MPPTKYSCLLRPLAYLYGLGVSLRNYLFDQGCIAQASYPIPILCVGNVTVGGTGKTPHVEYILSLLTPHYRVAVLSRGYRRGTRGLVIADALSTAESIGDEPMQIHLRFPEVLIAVDGDRRRAMRYLMSLPEGERPEVVVMDDGFQHRYVRPSYSILLTDCQRPMWEDYLLPAGTLRESASARYRADMVIVTKCPTTLSPIERRLIRRSLALYPHQHLFFSSIRYLPLRPLAALQDDPSPEQANALPHQACVYVLAGIANPRPLVAYLGQHYRVVGEGIYPDHHPFSETDLGAIDRQVSALADRHGAVYCVCTEKDAVRLWAMRQAMAPTLLERLYYLPIETRMMDRGLEFERLIRQAARAARTQSMRP